MVPSVTLLSSQVTVSRKESKRSDLLRRCCDWYTLPSFLVLNNLFFSLQSDSIHGLPRLTSSAFSELPENDDHPSSLLLFSSLLLITRIAFDCWVIYSVFDPSVWADYLFCRSRLLVLFTLLLTAFNFHWSILFSVNCSWFHFIVIDTHFLGMKERNMTWTPWEILLSPLKTRTSCDAWLQQRRQPVIIVKKSESSERKTGNKGSINLRKGLIYRIYRPFSNDLSPDMEFCQSSFFFFFVSGGRDVCP